METLAIHDAGQSCALTGGGQAVARDRVTIQVRAWIRANKTCLAYPFAVVPVHRTAEHVCVDSAQAKRDRTLLNRRVAWSHAPIDPILGVKPIDASGGASGKYAPVVVQVHLHPETQ